MTLERAYEAYKKEDFDGAEALLEPLLRQGNRKGSVLHLSALTALKRGQTYAALQRVNAALLDPINAHEMHNTRGLILRAGGAEELAVEAFRQALSIQPNYKTARENLASVLVAVGNPETAESELRMLAQNEGPSRKYTLALARALNEINEETEAFELLKNADITKSHRGLEYARLYLQLGDNEATLRYASDAYSDPVYAADALRLSLQVFAMSGTWGHLGPELIAKLTKLHPNSDDVWGTSANIAYRMNEKALAKNLFENSPKGPASLSTRAWHMILEKDYSSAEELAERALNIIPGLRPALSQYCLAALGKGDYNNSQMIADIALKSDPNNQFYYAIKATAGRKRGQDYGYYFNYKKFVQSYKLPTPEGWDTLESFNSDLAAELDELHIYSEAPVNQTLRGGSQTNPNLVHAKTPAISAFLKAAQTPISTYIKTIGTDPSHPFLRRNLGGFRIRSGWSVSLRPNGHHVNHVHPEGWISSSYYVDVPKSKGREGSIVFGEPSIDMGLPPELEIKPTAGTLVLFPSYLWHGTVPFKAGKRRLTLPIDIMPALPNS